MSKFKCMECGQERLRAFNCICNGYVCSECCDCGAQSSFPSLNLMVQQEAAKKMDVKLTQCFVCKGCLAFNGWQGNSKTYQCLDCNAFIYED